MSLGRRLLVPIAGVLVLSLAGLSILEIPGPQADAGLRTGPLALLATGAVLVALVWASIAWTLSRRLTRPLASLESKIRRIAAGDLDQMAGDLQGELGQVGQAVDRLAQTIKEERARLRESEARFKAFFEQAAVGIAVADLDGRWLAVNGRLCALLGYAESELLGQDMRAVIHPARTGLGAQGPRALLAQGVLPLRLEERCLRRDGGTVWVDLSLAQALGPDGEPSALICILQDIESRKAAESALAEGASALREAQRLAGIGHWRWDPQAERVRWSEELCRILGLDPAEAPARFDGIHRCFAPQAWTRLSEANRRALANGTPYELELEVLRPDGSPGWVLARGEPVRDPAGASVGLRGTLQDITLRREAERASSRDQDGELEDQRQARLAAINLVEDAIAARERAELSAAALKESESRFRTLFRSAAVSIMVHDGTTGEILEANPRALEAYGFETLEELKGRDSCGDFWLDPPYAFEDALKLLRQAVTAGPHHVEWMSAHRQGRIFWEDVLLSPLTLDGAPRVLAICTDITARRSAEEALKLQTDELKRRNEELERFNRATVGRELDMIELKRQVNALCLRLGDEPPFDLGFMDEPQADPEEVAP